MNLLARFLHKADISSASKTTNTSPSTSRKRKRSLDDCPSQVDASRKRASLRSAESPSPDTPPEQLPDPDECWGDHCWTSHIVSKLVAVSTQTIALISERGTRKFFVHKELLNYYSPYYRSITDTLMPILSDDGTSGRGERCLIAKTTQSALVLFTKWLYTRDLAAPSTDICDLAAPPNLDNLSRRNSGSLKDQKADLLHLYVFARGIECVALCRDILLQLHNDHASWFPTYELLEFLYKHLPPQSPVLKFLVSSHVQHWSPDMDTPQVKAVRAFHAPTEFLFAVIEGQAGRIRDLGGCERFDGLGESDYEETQAACCGDICDFHEHESEEERASTCGPPLFVESIEVGEDDTGDETSDER